MWLIASTRQLDRFAADFLKRHNRDRPHSSWDGRTPDEVFFGCPKRLRSLGLVDYFDGRLAWYRFGCHPPLPSGAIEAATVGPALAEALHSFLPREEA